MNTVTSKLAGNPTTAFEKFVLETVNDHDEPLAHAKDILRCGAGGGSVPSLIYYDNIVKVYEKYKEEFNSILDSLYEDVAETLQTHIFWEKGDYLVLNPNNQAVVTYICFEATLYNLANAAGLLE